MAEPTIPFWIGYVIFGLVGLFDPGRLGRASMVLFLIMSINVWKYYNPDDFLTFFTQVP